jgi:hypothetical protein
MAVEPVSPDFNKRKFPRKPVRAAVTYHYVNAKMNRVMTGTGFTLNLSQGGAMIRIENYLASLCEIDLHIQTGDGRTIRTKARVIRCNRVSFNRYDVGLQFISVKQDKSK